MRVNILGKRWGVVFEENLHRSDNDEDVGVKCDGYTDPVDRPNKAIYIDSELTGRDRLNTIIHEFTHAAMYYFNEDFVEEFGNDLADLLIKLGYRQVEELS